ncbi:MAG: hypothetical protein ILO36_00135, partial [Abditibacteriota bacterium]|nr:hypothetical protein [Abditibacteriota bacterium]
PAMLNVIDLGEDPKDLTDALMRLEAATKVPVFCDHFSDSGGVGANVLKLLNIGSLRQGTVYDVVSSLCDAYNLNMELANGHFDFSDIKWFEKIKAVVSKDTVSKWKNEYEATGYVSLDTLLEMGSFSPAQLSFALKSDASLATLAGPLVNNANVLEMLSMCDGAALANMMGESGVRSGYLNKRAFNAYRSLYQTAGFSGRTGCRIRLGSDIADNTLTYRVEFVPDDGSGTKKVEFAIPLFKK